MSNSDRLRQILDEHELYTSIQKMSSYAAAAASPSYHGSTTNTTLLAEHRLPRAHLVVNKTSPDTTFGKFTK